MSNKIIVAFSTDNTIFKRTYISLLSVLNNSRSFVECYILYSGLTDFELKFFRDLEKRHSNLKIHFKQFESSIVTKYPVFNYINMTYWFKFWFADMFPEVDKVLYLDETIIAQDDLFELYSTNLDGFYMAAVASPWGNIQLENLNLENKYYFARRVFLINCQKWRVNKVLDNLISNCLKSSSLVTSDGELAIINKFLGNKIYRLDCKYNYMEPWGNIKVQYPPTVMAEYYKAKNQPVIINFVGPFPEYSTCYHSKKRIWWEYAKKSPFKIKELQSYKLSATSAQNSFKYSWLLSRVFPYIKPYLPRIVLGFLMAIPLGLLDGVTAFALKPYMDYVIGGKTFALDWHGISFSISSLQMAFILPIGVILFAAFQGVLRYLNGYLSTWTSQRITNDVKFDLFDRLIHMHPQFFDENSSGVIIQRYMGDPATASSGIVDNIKTITTSLFGALGLIAVMLYSSWKLAIIGVVVLCAAFLPVALIRKRIKEASNKNMVIGGNITTNINETYSGNKVMAAYELQDRQNKYFKDQTWKSFDVNMSLYKRSGWMSPIMYIIASFGIATVLGVGTYLINSGEMTAGSFASFVTSLLLLYKPVKTLGNTLTGIQNIFVAMGRVFELFDLKPEITDCKNPITLMGLNKDIKLENVCFEYTPNHPVLKNINLTIPKNETLAIVGNSGGGKSTLVNLIPRFYDIKSGSIKIDDLDIREISLTSLRHNISMVFQDNFLYSGSIKENIMMGNPKASQEELMEAIKSAHLQDLISELPLGLDTELGERGMTLSGGQRQRVAIARAMLRNAPIVILDEATSALDNESEAIVQKAMDNLMQNRTVFIIAHRLSTIKNANRIAVINEGELVELGTHDELMSIENGQYKTLYEMQFKKQEVNV